MAPEYILHGLFSIKSDVFSFGVMILEMISGKRNASSHHQSHSEEDLLSYVSLIFKYIFLCIYMLSSKRRSSCVRNILQAWLRWKDQRAFELLDPTLEGCYSKTEASRCIQIGLLGVQENPNDRPTMATINLILNSDSLDLPLPREPAYFTGNRTEPSISLDLTQSTSYSVPTSTNEISMTNFSL